MTVAARSSNCASCPACTTTGSTSAVASLLRGRLERWRPEADRIGYRYKHGRPLKFMIASSPSAPAPTRPTSSTPAIPIGSIQVPSGTEPIILHRDAVSGGGYAMFGTVINADMDRIAQMQPSHKARFVPVDMTARWQPAPGLGRGSTKLRTELTAERQSCAPGH